MWKLFKKTCVKGYCALDTIKPGILNDNPWMYGSGYAPSLQANGRYRFVSSVEKARALSPKSVLEIAGGGGLFLSCLADNVEEAVLNDIRETQKELSYWKNGSKIKYKKGDCFKLQPTEKFDLVCAFEVIEHVAHADLFINKISEFVKPGGTLLLTTPNGKFFRSKLPTYSQLSYEERVALEKDQFKPDADGHLYLCTREEISELLLKAGYEKIQIHSQISPWISGEAGFRFLPKLRSLLPFYYSMEQFVQSLPIPLRDKLTTNLLVEAKKTVLTSHREGLRHALVRE